MDKNWTEFQRSCLQHIAGLLPRIRALVAALGSDALEVYCRYGCLGTDCIEVAVLGSDAIEVYCQHGCLDADCIERMKDSRFTQPDGDGAEQASDEEADDDSEGDNSQPAGGEEAEDESSG